MLPLGKNSWIITSENELVAPLKWRKTRAVSLSSDLFHESVPDEWIDRVFAVMALCPQLTFQVLTKRSARMWAYMIGPWSSRVMMRLSEVASTAALCDIAGHYASPKLNLALPLPNVWLGVSAEDQRRADERIPDLLNTPAAVRFVSAEPLLGPIYFTHIRHRGETLNSLRNVARPLVLSGSMTVAGKTVPLDPSSMDMEIRRPSLDWIIVGGESGKGARPMHPDWARSIRDQCAAADVPFFFKQWGAWVPNDEDAPLDWKSRPSGWLCLKPDGTHGDGYAGGREQFMRLEGKARAGRLLDGRTHDAMPTTQREVAP